MSARVGFSFPRLTPFVKGLMIALFAIFVAELVLENFVRVPVFQLLALTPGMLGPQTAWQVLTHVLVQPPSPGAVLGILIDLVFLWLIVAPFEESYGKARTIQLCITATLASALGALAVALAFGAPPTAFLAGSSPLMLAGLSAFAMTARGGQISFFGLFPMKPMHFILVSVAFAVLNFLASTNYIQLAGSLAAIGAGILFVKWMSRPRRVTRASKPKPTAASRLRVIEGGREDDGPKWMN